jgi:hypothetical protein
MNIVGTLSHASTSKRMRTHIQQKTSSAWCKTQIGDLKDGVVLIPLTECLWDKFRRRSLFPPIVSSTMQGINLGLSVSFFLM